MPGTIRWKVLELYWKNWGDHTVVYNFLSGNTHLLNSTAALILEVLQDEPATSVTVAKKLAQKLNLQVNDEIYYQVAQLLQDFDQLGIIQPFENSGQ